MSSRRESGSNQLRGLGDDAKEKTMKENKQEDVKSLKTSSDSEQLMQENGDFESRKKQNGVPENTGQMSHAGLIMQPPYIRQRASKTEASDISETQSE